MCSHLPPPPEEEGEIYDDVVDTGLDVRWGERYHQAPLGASFTRYSQVLQTWLLSTQTHPPGNDTTYMLYVIYLHILAQLDIYIY